MVACDNPSCPYIWFHFDCLKITAAINKLWFCPECSIYIHARGKRSISNTVSIHLLVFNHVMLITVGLVLYARLKIYAICKF